MVRHGSAKPITGVRVPSAPPDLTLKVVLRIISSDKFPLQVGICLFIAPGCGGLC